MRRLNRRRLRRCRQKNRGFLHKTAKFPAALFKPLSYKPLRTKIDFKFYKAKFITFCNIYLLDFGSMYFYTKYFKSMQTLTICDFKIVFIRFKKFYRDDLWPFSKSKPCLQLKMFECLLILIKVTLHKGLCSISLQAFNYFNQNLTFSNSIYYLYSTT